MIYFVEKSIMFFLFIWPYLLIVEFTRKFSINLDSNCGDEYKAYHFKSYAGISMIICKDYDCYNWMLLYSPRTVKYSSIWSLSLFITVYLLFQMILMSSLQLDKMQIRFLVAWILCWKLYNKCFLLKRMLPSIAEL